MPKEADDTRRGGLHDPDEAVKKVMECADMAMAGGNAAKGTITIKAAIH